MAEPAELDPIDQEYDITGEGLFVIIANMKFAHGDPLTYGPDVTKLKTLFKHQTNPGNFKIGKNLTRTPSSPGHQSYDEFIANEVLGERNEKPSFVMCFLMSHGNWEDRIALAVDDCVYGSESDEKCKKISEIQYSHTFEQGCRFRNVFDDFVNKIGQHKNFEGIPKIFIVQTCRGERLASTVISAATPVGERREWKAPDLIYSDMLLLFASVNNHPSFLDKEGSYLINSLVNANKLFDARKRNAATIDEDDAQGWIEDIIKDTRREASRYELGAYSKSQAKSDVTEQNYQMEKVQPECINTLNKRLSWLKIMNSLKPVG